MELGNKVYFFAKDSSGKFGLWQADATSANAALIKYVDCGSANVNVMSYGLTTYNGKLYFSGQPTLGDTVSGLELWTSDGTAAGTVMLKDLAPGAIDGHPGDFCVWNGRLYFTAFATATESKIWVSDGTAAGTVVLKDLYPGLASGRRPYFTPFNGRLYFSAYTPGSGQELWSTDGTTAGTIQVADIWPGTTGSSPLMPTVFDNRLFFRANDGVSGIELWSTDGITTTQFKDFMPGSAGSNPASLTVMGGRLYLLIFEGDDGYELWGTDGTLAGTARVKDINPGPGSSNITGLTRLGNLLIFNAISSATYYPSELWRSDGTGAGTVMIKDIHPGASGYSISTRRVVYNNKVYFTAAPPADTFGLWVTDGSEAGTMPLMPPGVPSGVPFRFYGMNNNLTVAQNSLFFGASYTTAGNELWRYQDSGNPSAISTVGAVPEALWTVYPSPANGVFTIKSPTGRQPAGSWRLSDLAGRIVLQGHLKESRTVVHYNLAPGLYFLQLQNAMEDVRMQLLLH